MITAARPLAGQPLWQHLLIGTSPPEGDAAAVSLLGPALICAADLVSSNLKEVNPRPTVLHERRCTVLIVLVTASVAPCLPRKATNAGITNQDILLHASAGSKGGCPILP